MQYATDPLAPQDKHRALLCDSEGFTVAVIKTPNPNAEAIAERLVAQRRCLEQAIAVIEDFMPNIGRCVLQDYGRLNDVLCESRQLLKPFLTGENHD